MWSQELGSMILRSPLQFGTLYDSEIGNLRIQCSELPFYLSAG